VRIARGSDAHLSTSYQRAVRADYFTGYHPSLGRVECKDLNLSRHAQDKVSGWERCSAPDRRAKSEHDLLVAPRVFGASWRISYGGRH
jgi:hypothetical protein